MKQLIEQAFIAREKAYAPYSGFCVGAALRTKSGKIFQGCNIENAAYSPTNCAERTAFFNALINGEHDFDAIAIVGEHENESTAPSPCGVCRQVMVEFCDPKLFQIIMARSIDDYEVILLDEMLPRSFGHQFFRE